jgi:hypothetical protein
MFPWKCTPTSGPSYNFRTTQNWLKHFHNFGAGLVEIRTLGIQEVPLDNDRIGEKRNAYWGLVRKAEKRLEDAGIDRKVR